MFSKFFHDSRNEERDDPEYTDATFVAGMLTDEKMQHLFYRKWTVYFKAYGYKMFPDLDERQKNKLMHECYLLLWMKVKNRKIGVAGGMVTGHDGKPFTSSLMTYLMSVAKKQKLVLIREDRLDPSLDDAIPCGTDGPDLEWLSTLEAEMLPDAPFEEDEPGLDGIVRDVIQDMSERCREVLTMFYYQSLSLDEILLRMDSFHSKNALKTMKKKCFDKLKEMANLEYILRLKGKTTP